MVQQLKDNETSKNGITASELYKASNTIYENLDLIKENKIGAPQSKKDLLSA